LSDAFPGNNIAWGEDFVGSNGESLVATVLSSFICPSDGGSDFTDNYFTMGQDIRPGKSNYVGCTGHNTWAINQTSNSSSDLWGILRINSRTRFSNITDGASNTILLGERTSEVGNHESGQRGAIWIGRMRGDHVAGGVTDGGHYGWGGRSGGLDFVVNGAAKSRMIASSRHPGGANCSLGDGSGHFVSDDLANTTLQNLCQMSDSNTVNNF